MEFIFDRVVLAIKNKNHAKSFVRDEVSAASKGGYEAIHFARKSEIDLIFKPADEIPYSSDDPQAVLTEGLNELGTSRHTGLLRLEIVDLVMKKYGLGKYRDNASKELIRRISKNRNIEKLIHFTQVENLTGILNLGLMSKEYMDEIGHRYIFNDEMRFDGELNAISLSLSFPNYKMFYKYRMQEKVTRWAVIILDPSIIWDEKCLFLKHNAADNRVRNISRRLGKPSDLERMFTGSREGLRKCDPSDPQAEVLVFNNISRYKISGIVVEKNEDLHLIKFSEDNFSPRILVDKTLFHSRSYLHK